MTLNPKRKADRAKIAQLVAEYALEAGAVSAAIESHDWSPRELFVAVVAPGGATLHFGIDGDCPDVVGGTWNTPSGVFLSPVLGEVNPFHFGKLNVYCATWDHAAAIMCNHLARLADGSGYLTQDAPQIVAMRARYAANGWQWHVAA